MRKQLIAATAMAFLTIGSQAQDGEHAKRTPQEQAKAQTERMTKELGLNAEQAGKAAAINARYAEQAEGIRQQRKAEREVRGKEMKAQRDAFRAAHRAEMKAVLTPTQYSTWVAKQDAMMEKRKAEQQERRAGRR